LLSHPALNGNGNGLQGVKDKFSKADHIAKQRAKKRQDQKDAPSARGWERRKGGWVADFAAPLKAAKRAQVEGRTSSPERGGREYIEFKASEFGSDLDGFNTDDSRTSSSSSSVTTSTTTTTTSQPEPELAIKKGMLSAQTVELLKERIKLASGEDINVITYDAADATPAPAGSPGTVAEIGEAASMGGSPALLSALESRVRRDSLDMPSSKSTQAKKDKKEAKRDKKDKKKDKKKVVDDVAVVQKESSPEHGLASPPASEVDTGKGPLSPFRQPDHDLLSPIASPELKTSKSAGTTPVVDHALQQKMDAVDNGGDDVVVKEHHSWKD
jgi:hypothetical protein